MFFSPLMWEFIFMSFDRTNLPSVCDMYKRRQTNGVADVIMIDIGHMTKGT